MTYEILVDGYNVIKNNTMFKHVEDKSQAEARNLLIKQISNRYRKSSDRVIIVFDGKGAREETLYQEHIRVIYSCDQETADMVIARLAAIAQQEGRQVLLYSDDGEVKYNVTRHGGHALTTHGLVSSMNAAPSDVAQRAEFRMAMRRMYGMDPSYKVVDNEEGHYYDPDKRNKSSRRYKSIRTTKRTLRNK
ncbi:NYN domain-containing protein [Ktedonobacteria bacterium brp13]|nr:NYN domain-containing protein [Ktedonobacteria bacterium brp13]